MAWLEILARFGGLIALIGQGVIGWVIWSLRRQFVGSDEFRTLGEGLRQDINGVVEANRAEQQQLGYRVSLLEMQLGSVPSKESLHHLEKSLVRCEGQVAGVAERITGFEKILERTETVLARQEQYLLEQSR